MTEECTIRRERRVTRERQRVRRQRERCRRGSWWQQLWCHIENYFRWIRVEVVSWVEEQICHIATAVEEAVSAFVEWIIKLTNDLHIIPPLIRRVVESVPNTSSFSRSFAASIDYEDINQRLLYSDEGKFFEFKIEDGKVYWRSQAEQDFKLFVPIELPSIGIVPPRSMITAPLVVSYHAARRGLWSWADDLQFDMIAASSDRIFVKERGSDNFFLALPTHLYLHKTDEGRPVKLPQTLFKLDPEINLPGQQLEDLLLHIRVPLDDETHLATERFPAFRTIFTILRSPFSMRMEQHRRLMLWGINPTAINNEFTVMCAQVPPFVWVSFDTRPIHKSKNPPRRFASYNHITYGNNPFSVIPLIGNFLNSLIRVRKRSIRFRRVLSLGVGLSHLHEQYLSIYGGEADNLQSPTFFKHFPLANFISTSMLADRDNTLANEDLYRLANGPIEDIGGWVDGTCLYYMMVQLKSDEEIEKEEFNNAYCILWLDEQFAFTERWRALHYIDSEFDSPMKPIVSVIKTEHEFYSFDYRKFWCPFENGHIRPYSRMTVSRQVIIVNGYDANENEHELYSIHFCWPTMDHTWRVRRLPEQAAVMLLASDKTSISMDEIAQNHATTVYPQTIHLKEDMTISMKGSLEIEGKFIPGYWTQKYLPANNNERPSLREIKLQEAFEKPVLRYDHPWEFFPAHVFDLMLSKFSHFAVFQKVDSRIQFYTVELDAHGLDETFIENTVWVDSNSTLTINRLELNWSSIQFDTFFNDLRSWDFINNHLERIQRPSLFENLLRLRIKKVEQLGFILMYADKRDDKTITFDQMNESVTLFDETNFSRFVTVTLVSHKRNSRSIQSQPLVSPPEVSLIEVNLHCNPDHSPSYFSIRIIAAREMTNFPFIGEFEEWIKINLNKVKLGFPDGENNIIFDANIHEIFQRTIGTNEFTGRINISATYSRNLELSARVEETSRRNDGVSVGFEGVTGLVNVAEKTYFFVTKL